ncbi:MAG: hypothetical protein NVSMB9_28560 [Isosphaeraceae bacterium]
MPFSPSDIPGLNLWLKGDAGLFTDIAKTTPATNGTAVAVWADQSGNLRDASQSTAGARPVLRSTRYNGFPAVQFDGVSQTLLTSVLPQSTIPYTMICALQVDDTSGSRCLVYNGAGGSGYGFYVKSPNRTVAHQGSSLFYDSFSNATLTREIWSAVEANPGLSFYVGGVAHVSSGTATDIAPAGTAFTLGAFNNPGPTEYGAVTIAEVLLWPTALSNTDRGNVETYLTNRYATPVSSPRAFTDCELTGGFDSMGF